MSKDLLTQFDPTRDPRDGYTTTSRGRDHYHESHVVDGVTADGSPTRKINRKSVVHWKEGDVWMAHESHADTTYIGSKDPSSGSVAWTRLRTLVTGRGPKRVIEYGPSGTTVIEANDHLGLSQHETHIGKRGSRGRQKRNWGQLDRYSASFMDSPAATQEDLQRGGLVRDRWKTRLVKRLTPQFAVERSARDRWTGKNPAR